ncbi:Phage integrase family protein [Blastococcus aggregatus]|uniref:Phage integrase family protein n=1 Tax=Blastococcus aggregatus TaxID=38502 RepID=A0A285V148_9ACTN|nr:tyrosine-type recombinase/integrase [Blastococcus aggregatus]SOC47834.1 Phage integrase family protein [Blastococcus aggregatus]
MSALDAGISALLDLAHHAPRTLGLADEEQRKLAEWAAAHGNGVTAMPALPVVVASYLAWMAAGEVDVDGRVLRRPYARSTIRIARGGIGLAHRRAGASDPTADPYVRAVMRGIARCLWIRRPRQQDPLTDDLLLKLVTLRPPLPAVTAVRDRAAVLVARATGMTLTEVAALPRSALTILAARAVLRLPTGPVTLACRCTAPAGELLCPVAVLRDLDADLPARAELLFGVVHADRNRGAGPLTYPESAATERVLRAVQAAVCGAGVRWPARAPLPVHDDDALALLMARLDPETTTWVRDTAALLVGWHLALRGGEVGGALAMADLTRDPLGYTARLGRTKGDQVAAGTPLSLMSTREPLLNPVAALDAWLLRRGRDSGPVFTSMHGGRPRLDRPMTTTSVSRTVRARAAAAGLTGRYSSHSLRIGFVVTAVKLGASIPDLMTVTRHRDPDMVGYYARGLRGRADPKVLAEVLGWKEPAA